MTKTMDEIERLAARFAATRNELRRELDIVEKKVGAIRERHADELRRLVSATVERREALNAAVEESPALFKKPKSRILHGIRLGFAKAKGKVEFTDPAKVVARIKRLFPDQAETLIKITETPVKDALAKFAGADLKRLGVTITDDQDNAFVRPVDTEIDKLIEALLAENGDDKETGEAAGK